MKSVVADYESRIHCIRIVPATNAPVVRFAAYPHDITMSNGQVYLAENGYEFSGLESTSTFSSSSIDLKGILQADGVTLDALASGQYDNARVYLFATSFAAPVEDEEPLFLGFFGRTEFDSIRETYTAQLMGAIDVLSQSVGRSYSPSCQWILFDETLDGGDVAVHRSRCRGPRAAPDGPVMASFLVTGTITSVTSQYVIADSARTEADDWFGEGSIRFLTGPNAGLRAAQIKAYTQAGGVIEVHEALFYVPEVGDQYEMIPGCRKRLDEDCVTKFGNGINFGGHKHIPAPSQYGQVGRRQ